MTSVRELNDTGEIARLSPLWHALLDETPRATFFQSPQWLEVYWRHFGGDQKLRLLVVEDDGRPSAIVPLAVRTETTRVGPLRVLTYPLHDWGTFYGPIGPRPAAALRAAIDHVRRTPRDWDLLDLRWVDAHGGDSAATADAMRRAGFRPHRQVWDRAALVDSSGSWEQYWDSRAKKWRHEADRVLRRITRLGQVALVRYRPAPAEQRDGDPRWDLYDQCVELARRSWQGDSLDGTTLCHPQVAAFLRELHAVAARAGAVDLNLLELDGRPVAFAYNYCYRGWVYGLRKGFDPAVAALRPGTVLQRLMLEDSFRRGDQLVDLGVGSLENKLAWQTRLAASCRYTHFPLSVPRAQLMRLSRLYRACRYGAEDVACA